MRSDWSEQIGMAREAGLNEDGSSDDSEARRLAIIAAYTFDRPDISRQLNQLAGLAARVWSKRNGSDLSARAVSTSTKPRVRSPSATSRG
jgi:hypothetical protein